MMTGVGLSHPCHLFINKGGYQMNFMDDSFTTIEKGIEELKRAVDLRNSMGGEMYYNMLNEDVLRIADKLIGMGADRSKLEGIMGTWQYA